MFKKHTIWSNHDLHIDDWRDGYAEHLEINGLDLDPNDEDAIYDWMQDMNDQYLDDERSNLDIQLSRPILVIADLGRWNGRFCGYKEIESGNIKDCLTSDTDLTTWFIDDTGDLRCDAFHHDGMNHYLYRAYRDDAADEQIESLKEKIYEGKATQADIDAVTRRLGDDIGKVYGLTFDTPTLDEQIALCAAQANNRRDLAEPPSKDVVL